VVGTIRDGLTQAGHEINWYEIVKDDKASLRSTLLELAARKDLDMIVATGGTGLSPADVTVEAAKPLFEKEIPAFAVMFAMLSHEQVGMACLLSRAAAGVMGGKIVFCLPGSPKPASWQWRKSSCPRLGIWLKHAREK